MEAPRPGFGSILDTRYSIPHTTAKARKREARREEECKNICLFLFVFFVPFVDKKS